MGVDIVLDEHDLFGVGEVRVGEVFQRLRVIEGLAMVGHLDVTPVLNAELDDHLDNEAAEGSRNRRNGFSKKTVLTETAKIDIRIPRDREGTFDPKLIQRYQRRFPGFDDKIVSMYARAMTVREIQGHLLELYGLEVSPDLISTVTGRGARDSR